MYKRQVGIRLEIPDTLISTFKLLENEGYLVSKGMPGSKRSIKFDDATKNLVIDIKLPGKRWTRIRPDQIHESRQTRDVEAPAPAVEEVLAIAAAAAAAAARGPPTAASRENQSSTPGDEDEDMFADGDVGSPPA